MLRAACDFLHNDWRKSRATVARTCAQRSIPCFACGYELRGSEGSERCSECGVGIDWSPGLWRDGRHHLALAILVALAPAGVRIVSLKLERMWNAYAHELASVGLPIDVASLLWIDAVSFLAQFTLLAIALLMSLHRTRAAGHALTRFGMIALIGAAHWTFAPQAHLWL